MKLESARSLQNELALLLGEYAAIAQTATYSIKHGAPGKRARAPKVTPVALGIVPSRKGDHKIAVRVGRARDLESPEVQLVLKRAANEVDLRVTGLIRPHGAARGIGPWSEAARSVISTARQELSATL